MHCERASSEAVCWSCSWTGNLGPRCSRSCASRPKRFAGKKRCRALAEDSRDSFNRRPVMRCHATSPLDARVLVAEEAPTTRPVSGLSTRPVYNKRRDVHLCLIPVTCLRPLPQMPRHILRVSVLSRSTVQLRCMQCLTTRRIYMRCNIPYATLHVTAAYPTLHTPNPGRLQIMFHRRSRLRRSSASIAYR